MAIASRQPTADDHCAQPVPALSSRQATSAPLRRILPVLAIPRSSAIMPTPESESFLAKKPTVPPTFDGVDYDDNKRLKQAQDAVVREQWVQVMMGRLVREELSKCYVREGVNHLEKCGSLRGQYGGMGRHRMHLSAGIDM